MSKKSNKIKNDKYYTPIDLAQYVVNKTHEIIGEDNISEYLESSAGNGVFLDVLDDMKKKYLAYDIEPEDVENRIIKQDYLKLDLDYKKGRCVIGNPPFGSANSLLKQFYKKSVQLCDYMAFIMPVSQYKNDNELYDFDMIYSEDLGNTKYSERDIHCCLNIYSKPKNKKKKPSHKYNDMKIIGWRKAKEVDCDFYICCYGSSTGTIVDRECGLVNINGIQIYNERLRSKIKTVFAETDWLKLYPMTTTPNLLQWQMYRHLKDQIPELE